MRARYDGSARQQTHRGGGPLQIPPNERRDRAALRAEHLRRERQAALLEAPRVRVVIEECEEFGLEPDDLLRAPRRLQREVRVRTRHHRVRPRDESRERRIVARDQGARHADAPARRVPSERVGGRDPHPAVGGRGGEHRAQLRLFAEPREGVHRHHAIVEAPSFVVPESDEGADARVAAEELAHPSDGEACRVRVVHSRAILAHHQRAGGRATGAEPVPRARRDRTWRAVGAEADTPGEEREHDERIRRAPRSRAPLAPHGEEVGVLEEELAPLREEDTEAGEIHHLPVHVRLGEVRVHGRLEQTVRGRRPDHLATDRTGRPTEGGRRVVALPLAEPVQARPHVRPRRGRLQRVEHPRVREAPRGELAGVGHPCAPLEGAPGVADEVDVPALEAARIAE